MARAKLECEWCGQEVPPGTGSRGGAILCGSCKSKRYFWRKRGESAAVERVRTLHRWADIMFDVIPVIANNSKRAQAQLTELFEESERTAHARLRQALGQRSTSAHH